mgnify:CR=1 FL=1
MTTEYMPTTPRVRIEMLLGKVMHGLAGEPNEPARVVIARNRISVGCTDTSPEVLEFLLDEHRKRFPKKDEFVIQEGRST